VFTITTAFLYFISPKNQEAQKNI